MPGDGLAAALSSGDGLGVPSGDGEAVGLGDGVGEPFFFLPDLGEGDGEFFGVGVTEASGVAVGEAVAFGVLVAVGVALAFGVGELFGFGDGVDDFFFAELLELFRFFFGAGVGSKMLLILSPNDCASIAGGDAKANARATTIAMGIVPTAVIPRPRRRRGISHRLKRRAGANRAPGIVSEVLRRASPASG